MRLSLNHNIKTLFENKPNMILSFSIRISSEFENMNLDLVNIADFKISDVPPGPLVCLVFYFHCIMTRSLKLILLFFELNFMSYCLTFQTMKLYLQMVLRMMTQLDQPVIPSDTYKCRLPDSASIFFSGDQSY